MVRVRVSHDEGVVQEGGISCDPYPSCLFAKASGCAEPSANFDWYTRINDVVHRMYGRSVKIDTNMLAILIGILSKYSERAYVGTILQDLIKSKCFGDGSCSVAWLRLVANLDETASCRNQCGLIGWILNSPERV